MISNRTMHHLYKNKYQLKPINILGYTIADLKILLYVRVHTKVIPGKIRKEFSSYISVKFTKCLFTNIQKQYNMLKISLLFQKNTNFTNNSRILTIKNAKFSGCYFIRIYGEIFKSAFFRDFSFFLSIFTKLFCYFYCCLNLTPVV